ncbi:MAG: TPM domain-containing protein [Bacteroidetes bacterium]|nr:TPM domain-containing protein [Bacteroidota bacterium]
MLLNAQEVPVPIVHDPVTDLTNTLTPSEYSSLRSKILTYEDSTSNQILLLLIPTLGENEIRDYGMEILKQNKIGQKGKDNGVLVLVAKEDHKMSIEVGYGLEGVLTDALTNDIIRNQMAPYFRQDKYYEGLDAAVTSIIAVTKGEYKAEEQNQNDDLWVGLLIVAIVFFFSIISAFRNMKQGISSRGHRSSGMWWWGGGGGSGGSSWGSFGGGGGGGSWSGGGGSFGGGGSSGSW